jgi:ankyrin repeat protein
MLPPLLAHWVMTFDPNSYRTETPLMRAADKDDVGLVKALIAAGADLEVQGPYGGTALARAAALASFESATLLVGAGANVNAVDDGDEAVLSQAILPVDHPQHVRDATERSARLVGLLLTHGADVDARSASGETALYKAAQYNRRPSTAASRGRGGRQCRGLSRNDADRSHRSAQGTG